MPLLAEDEEAHRSEHALEVQLPFLQVLAPGFQFVPIAVGTSNFEVLERAGSCHRERACEQDERVLIVASSDMNHYESDDVTRVKDRHAIEPDAGARSARALRRVRDEQHQHVRIRPAVVMLTAARKLGAKQARTDPLRHLWRCLGRQGHGRGLRGNRGPLKICFCRPSRSRTRSC